MMLCTSMLKLEEFFGLHIPIMLKTMELKLVILTHKAYAIKDREFIWAKELSRCIQALRLMK